MKKYVLFGLLLSLSNIQSAEGRREQLSLASEEPKFKTRVRGFDGEVVLTQKQLETQNYGIAFQLALGIPALFERSQRHLLGAVVLGVGFSDALHWPVASDVIKDKSQ